MDNKTKVLFLSTFDNDLPGHAYSIMNSLPTGEYESRLFVLSNKYENTHFSLVGKGFFLKVYWFLLKVLQRIYVLFRFKIFPSVDKTHSEYCYFTNDFLPSYARIILRKLKGFKPDIISVHWVAGFVSSATIRDLYKITGAKIVLCLIDQQQMMGGCHYSIDCEGFTDGCFNCPALKKGKLLSHYQLENKKKNFCGIPIILKGTPYDLRIATTKSFLFKDKACTTIRSIVRPNSIIKTPRQTARKKFSINNDKFVVLLGGASVFERRKGIKYAIEAIHYANESINNLVVLLVGKINESELKYFEGIELVSTGYLSMPDLFEAYCASNCYLSSTIGDSGPVMVNFAIELGIPVVAFNVGISETIVLHQKTGYIAEYKNSQDLANGLIYIASLSEKAYSDMRNSCLQLLPELSKDEPWYQKVRKL